MSEFEVENMTGLEIVREARRSLADLIDQSAPMPWRYDEGLFAPTASVIDDDGSDVCTGILDGTGRLIGATVGNPDFLAVIDSWWQDAENGLAEIEASGSSALGTLINMTGGGRHRLAIHAARMYLAKALA